MGIAEAVSLLEQWLEFSSDTVVDSISGEVALEELREDTRRLIDQLNN